MYHANFQKIRKTTTASGKSLWWLISAEDGAPNFELRYIEIKEGEKTSGNAHAFEHEIYVIKGEGVIHGDDEQQVKIQKEDAVLVLPDETHQIINTGNSVLGFICIIPKGAEDHIK